MGSKYIGGYNPFQDFLLQSLLYGADISNKKLINDIYSSFTYILQNVLNDEKNIIHLDFEIKKTKNGVKVVGNNLITAMWLSGIFPSNVGYHINRTEFKIDNRLYKYNKKTKELSFTIINKKQ